MTEARDSDGAPVNAEAPRAWTGRRRWRRTGRAAMRALSLSLGVSRWIDAEGRVVVVGRTGETAEEIACEGPVRAARFVSDGGWVTLVGDEILRHDERGRVAWRLEMDGARCLATSASLVVAAGPHLRPVVLTVGGRHLGASPCTFPAAFLAAEGQRVAAASGSGALVVWRHARGARAAPDEVRPSLTPGRVSALAMSGRGHVALASHGAGILVHDPRGETIATLDVGDAVRCLDFAPRGDLLLVADAGARLHLLDVDSGFRLWTDGWERSIVALELHGDAASGRAEALVASDDGHVTSLELTRERTVGRPLELSTTALASRVARATRPGSVSRDPEALFFDVLPVEDGRIHRFQVAPDGRSVVVLEPPGVSAHRLDASGSRVESWWGLPHADSLAVTEAGLFVRGPSLACWLGSAGRPSEEVELALADFVLTSGGVAALETGGRGLWSLAPGQAGRRVGLPSPAHSLAGLPGRAMGSRSGGVVLGHADGSVSARSSSGDVAWIRQLGGPVARLGVHDDGASPAAVAAVDVRGTLTWLDARTGEPACRASVGAPTDLATIAGRVVVRRVAETPLLLHPSSEPAPLPVGERARWGLVEAPPESGGGSPQLVVLVAEGDELLVRAPDGRLLVRARGRCRDGGPVPVPRPGDAHALGGTIAFRVHGGLGMLRPWGEPDRTGRRAALLELPT